MEKVVALIIVLVILVVIIAFFMSSGGPKDMVYAIINFFNSSINLVASK
jgi:hypothetical protein